VSSRSLDFVVPGDLQTLTGGYGYDRRILAGLQALGWRVSVQALDSSFPHPTSAALSHADQVFAGLHEQALVLVDGLALGAMPQVVRAHSSRLNIVALVHHPLAAESGLEPARALELQHSERQALLSVRHVIVTSHATKQALAAYGIAPERISVVQPGTDEAPLARRQHDALQLLCVAAVTPRKGHDVLINALAPLASLRWTLTCVGSTTRDPATAAQLRSLLAHLGLEKRVLLTGEVSAAALSDYFLAADLFVMPTRLEGYGMAVAEALAHGLPVIGTQTGAVADLVGSEAGLLVKPDDVHALRAALERVLKEPALRVALAKGAAAVRNGLRRWPQACALMAQILERVAGLASSQ
jgi:glycosyltransferase involved in cell wall biosynthesis